MDQFFIKKNKENILINLIKSNFIKIKCKLLLRVRLKNYNFDSIKKNINKLVSIINN